MKEKTALDRPLRIALAVTELGIGGAERCVTNLAIGLDRERFQPQVYSLAGRPAPERGEFVTRLEAAGVPVHFLGLRTPTQFLTGLKRLQSLFKEQAPDVVQTFLIHANILGTMAAARAGTPAVSTGIRVADPRRHRLWLERLVTARVDRIVCVSQATADYMATRGRFRREQMTVIPNGIDLAPYERATRLDPVELGAPPGRKMIAVVGRLDRQKGLDWLLEFTPQLLRGAPEHDLVLVGDGPQKAWLKAQALRLGVADHVHFLGWRTDIPSILAASDLLMLPSRWEGMPNVVLEAMASRLPVVTTACEGVKELLGENAEPQMAVFGDSQTAIGKALAIIHDANLAEQLRAANRQRAHSQFSLPAMIRRYEELFTSLARRPN